MTTTHDAVLDAVRAAWRSSAGSAPLPELASRASGDDRSLAVTPATPDAAPLWIDYGSSHGTVWVAVGRDSRFEVEGDLDALASICSAAFEGRFGERLRVHDGRVLESQGFIDASLATTHRAAWARGLRASLRASAWQEVAYGPYVAGP